MKIIQSEVARLQQNVEDILHSSLLDSRVTFTKEAVEVKEFIGDLVDKFKSEYSSQMIEWSVEGNSEKTIQSNKKLLENIFRNLVDNAIKYGGKEISFKVVQDPKKTTISVSDNGVGIDEKYHKKVFSRFFRIPEIQNQHNQKGFGLGLQIVQSAIKKLHGKIALSSTPNVGSTFTITLPNG